MKIKTTVCLILAVLSFSIHAQESSEGAFRLDPEAITNLKLKFAPVSKQSVSLSLQAIGVVKLDERKVYDVTSRIDGVVSRSDKQLGERVETGDVLCEIQSAQLSEMISNYVAAEETMGFAATAAYQERELAEKKLSSAEQLRQRELELKQAISAHARALQPLKLLHFDEGTIHQFLSSGDTSDYTTLALKASGDGEIVVREVRNGAAVQHDDLLFTVANLSELWVDFQIALRDAPSLSIGETVKVRSSVTEKVQDAEIIYVSPLADERSRTVMIRAALPNSEYAWRPGTPVQVEAFAASGAPNALSVPAGAIVDFDGGKAVFVKSGDTEFTPAAVTVGKSDGEMTQIVSGLIEGQTVVSENAAQLKGHLEMTAGE